MGNCDVARSGNADFPCVGTVTLFRVTALLAPRRGDLRTYDVPIGPFRRTDNVEADPAVMLHALGREEYDRKRT
jgi:hypothetical protein